MITVALEDRNLRLDDLVRRAEDGERVVLTRDGRPIADVVPHEPAPSPPEPHRGGIDYEAMRRYLDERGIDEVFAWVSPDFDDPLPEDFLLRPLPAP